MVMSCRTFKGFNPFAHRVSQRVGWLLATPASAGRPLARLTEINLT
jgi:hypothetical protein